MIPPSCPPFRSHDHDVRPRSPPATVLPSVPPPMSKHHIIMSSWPCRPSIPRPSLRLCCIEKYIKSRVEEHDRLCSICGAVAGDNMGIVRRPRYAFDPAGGDGPELRVHLARIRLVHLYLCTIGRGEEMPAVAEPHFAATLDGDLGGRIKNSLFATRRNLHDRILVGGKI